MKEVNTLDKFENEYLYCWSCNKKCLPEELLDHPTKTGMIRWYCFHCYEKIINTIEV